MTDTLQVNTPFCGDDHDPSSLSVDLAIEKILQTITPLADENYELVSLRQSLDRVLAQAIIAPINVPPHNNSAMDGYALSASDLPENNTKQLNIIGSSLAGHPYLGRCQTGQCVRIMTGAVMP